ncbi:MAG: hypothetical protein GY797_32570 [Deltaproteobacteria bacterium]|nr:hypothetical protein [Deltaproteobacteria bacterium]
MFKQVCGIASIGYSPDKIAGFQAIKMPGNIVRSIQLSFNVSQDIYKKFPADYRGFLQKEFQVLFKAINTGEDKRT